MFAFGRGVEQMSAMIREETESRLQKNGLTLFLSFETTEAWKMLSQKVPTPTKPT